MDIITGFFSTLWTELQTSYIPILDISFTSFLLGIFFIFTLWKIIRFILGMGEHSDKRR